MIVKNLLVVGVVAGFASAAAAGEEGKANFKVGAAIRMDNEQMVKETKPSIGEKETEKSSKVHLKNAQFSLTGSQGSDTLYVKYYANENYLRTATITHKFMDMLSVTFGKQQLLAQSFETSYDSNDVYLYSIAHDFSKHDQAGAKVTLSFGDHSIALQAVQGDSATEYKDGVATNDFASTGGLTTAIQYRGNIMDMIRPMITYTMVNTAGSKGMSADKTTAFNYGNGYQTQMGAGVQIAAAGALVDLEYDTVKLHKQKSSEEKDKNIQSIIAQVKYTVGDTTPFVKLTSDSYKKGADQGINDVTRMAFAVGVEHKLDEVCRIHAFYMNDAWKVKTSADSDTKISETGFNLGVTAKM